MRIIKCKEYHLEQVVDIFWQAFNDSILYFAKPKAKLKKAFLDIFQLLWLTFPDGFLLAVNKDKVVGYIVVVKDIKKLWLKSLSSGFIFKVFAKWLLRRYGIGLKQAVNVLLNKIYYLIFEGNTENCAQILSVAVRPAYQGQGIGEELVGKGLEHLKKERVKKVKLEVRPDNIPAKKIYSKFGFSVVYKTKDLQGEWLIMKANLEIHKVR